jgi:hypothetical protein
MTLREYIDSLEELISDDGVSPDIEVVAIPPNLGESYTPVISVGYDKDGVRRLFVT